MLHNGFQLLLSVVHAVCIAVDTLQLSYWSHHLFWGRNPNFYANIPLSGASVVSNTPLTLASLLLYGFLCQRDGRSKEHASTPPLKHWCAALMAITSEPGFISFPLQIQFKDLSISPANSCAKSNFQEISPIPLVVLPWTNINEDFNHHTSTFEVDYSCISVFPLTQRKAQSLSSWLNLLALGRKHLFLPSHFWDSDFPEEKNKSVWCMLEIPSFRKQTEIKYKVS